MKSSIDTLQRIDRLCLARNIVLALALILISCAAGTFGLAIVNPKHALSAWVQLAAGGHLRTLLLPLVLAGLTFLSLAGILHLFKMHLLAKLPADSKGIWTNTRY